MIPHTRLALVTTLALLISPANAQDPEPTNPLKGLSQEQARAVVIAALKQRDSKLANFSYSAHERITRVTPDKRQRISDITVEFRRHPGGVWMHMSRFRGGSDVPYEDRYSNWKDGQQRKITLRPATGDAKEDAPTCYIGTNPNTEMRSFSLNQVLGIYILEDGPMISVARWLEESTNDPHRQVTCSTADYKGRPAVTVVVQYGGEQARTFWFDPARDWMTVATDYFSGPPDNKTNWGSGEVVRADRIDGVWLPLAATVRGGTSVSSGGGEYEYTVVTARLGAVKESDLEVVFPAGAIVSDPIHGTRYRLEPDGSHTPAPRGK